MNTITIVRSLEVPKISLAYPQTVSYETIPKVLHTKSQLEANHSCNIVGYHFSSRLTATLNLCLIYVSTSHTIRTHV